MSTSFFVSDIKHGHKGSIDYGLIHTPFASSRAAYGNILTPMVHAKAKHPGNVLLVLAGAHGDEVEGVLGLNRIVQQLSAEDLEAGEVIIIPCANMPAMMNGTRCSPIDNQDMNRVYPGNPQGTPTERMADFILNHLIPEYGVTHVIDIHSGGKTLSMLPHVAYHNHDASWEYNTTDHVPARKELANMVTSFKHIVLANEPDFLTTLDHHVEKQGIPFCYIECQGGGTSPLPGSVRSIDQGIRNVMVKLGILNKNLQVLGPQYTKPSKLYIPHGSQLYLHSHPGLLELIIGPGDTVTKGDLIGRVHPYLMTTKDSSMPLYADTSGVVIAMSNQTLIEAGDTLVTIASEWANDR